MLSERKIYYWIPFSIELFALYNSVLIRCGIRYLYLFFAILGLLFFIRKKILCKSKSYFFSIAVYIVSVLFSSFLLFLSDAAISIIMGAVVYVLPLFYWLLYDEKRSTLYFPQLIVGLKYPVLLIAILGCVQFYVSPDLFGIINLNDPVDPYVIKASSDVFSNWIFYLRATSILASPQVYGLFMILYAISFFTYAEKKKISNMILISIYLFAGAHSGNKSFFLILILYAGYYLLKTGSLKSKVIALFVVFFLSLVVIHFSDEVSFLSRIVSVENLSDEEKDGRLSVYKELLKDASFLGDGAGSHMTLSGELSDKPTESYFLQILIELGVIPFICFLSVFLVNYIKSGRRINIMIFFIALSMFVVHCFNAFVFFVMWGWFFVSPPSINSNKNL